MIKKEKEIKLLNNKNEVEEIELQIIKAQINDTKRKLLDMHKEKIIDKFYEKKMCSVFSKIVKKDINTLEDCININPSIAMLSEVVDEVYWDKKDFIRPSQFLCEFSFIKKDCSIVK